jgi:predicted amidophosphoribosyltransferase
MTERIVRISGRLKALFDAEGNACLACGAPLAASAGLTGPATARFLCRRCREDVPWIRPGDIRCAVCGRAELCPDCPRRTNPAFVMNRSAVRYTDRMKEWLARLKYRGDEKLAGLFAHMMAGALERMLDERGLRRRDIACLTCVPASEERLRERGFNQTELIARRLAGHARIPFVPLLARTRHTGKMSQKTRAERLRLLEGAFAVPESPALERILRKAAVPAAVRFLPASGRTGRRLRDPDPASASPELAAPATAASALAPPAARPPLRIVLIDDVYTTGSTMQECARAIRRRFPEAEVYGLTWAR